MPPIETPTTGLGSRRVCSWRMQWTFDNPVRSLIHPPAKVLGHWVKPGMTAVDVGCGTGHFSLGLARLVGPTGNVTSVDLQPQALAKLMRRAGNQGLEGIITPRTCAGDDLGPLPRADFVLGFWMAHEVPDVQNFFAQIGTTLKPQGRLLVVEPRIHVRASRFEAEVEQAQRAGLCLESRPEVRLSRAALFRLP